MYHYLQYLNDEVKRICYGAFLILHFLKKNQQILLTFYFGERQERHPIFRCFFGILSTTTKTPDFKIEQQQFPVLVVLLLCTQMLAVLHLADLVGDLIACKCMCFKGY